MDMASTPVPRVLESFEGRPDGGLRGHEAARAPERLEARRSTESGPKSPNVQVTEDAPRRLFGFQFSVMHRAPRRRADATSPPQAPVGRAGAHLLDAPQLPPPPVAPSEFPGTPIRPQTARSNYSSRSNYGAD